MKNQVSSPRESESGNIFLWILVMIALFAALSYAATQSLRGAGASISQDRAKVVAAEIIQYGNAVKTAYKTMRIDGIPVNQMSYEMVTHQYQNGTPMNIANTNCTTNACRLFHAQGGKAPERQFFEYGVIPSWWNAGWSKVGTVEFNASDVVNLGTSLPEVTIRVVQIHPNICKEVNKLQGITTWPINEDVSGKNYYILGWTGVNAALAATDAYQYGRTQAELVGKQIFCTGDDTDGGNIHMVMEVR